MTGPTREPTSGRRGNAGHVISNDLTRNQSRLLHCFLCESRCDHIRMALISGRGHAPGWVESRTTEFRKDMNGIVYIVGSGRSGSTVVERVLSSSPDVFGVGEIHALWRLPLNSLLCSCGKRVPECSFWCDALDASKLTEDDFRRLTLLEKTVIRNKYLLKLRYDLDRIRKDERISEFNSMQKMIFSSIMKSSGASVVIDSSKAGPRAFVLAAELDPVFIHTYRDAGEIIASSRRPKFEPSTGSYMDRPPILRTAVDWIKVEQSARSLRRIGSKVARIDYLDFSNDPRSALSRSLDLFFPNLVDTINWTGSNSVRPSNNYHSVLGNPDRFDSGDIIVSQQSARQRSRFSAVETLTISTVGGLLSRFYR